eukprot:CAMPEP_0172004040 /NCGR_PEP_ID=MMETSP1041-20130122/4252_1 /TAXON_ID=464988 /ORGANISM="Hemiselmis andersenii, Strain CCMP439" /LENGTH=109 /DNA_ID=CAMNT_0012657843 /DNA_START=166 /DNA_END=491 /DNA_ORIENTATION=+
MGVENVLAGQADTLAPAAHMRITGRNSPPPAQLFQADGTRSISVSHLLDVPCQELRIDLCGLLLGILPCCPALARSLQSLLLGTLPLLLVSDKGIEEHAETAGAWRHPG